jgi:hypothetical protein
MQVFADCYSADGRHFWSQIELAGDEKIFGIGRVITITAGEYENDDFRVAEVYKKGNIVHMKLFSALPNQ